MNINGIPAAAANLAGQALTPRGSDAERASRDAANLNRAQAADHKAEVASDVGETADDVETGDGDPDGRQLLEQTMGKRKRSQQTESIGQSNPAPDPDGELGIELDLQG